MFEEVLATSLKIQGILKNKTQTKQSNNYAKSPYKTQKNLKVFKFTIFYVWMYSYFLKALFINGSNVTFWKC